MRIPHGYTRAMSLLMAAVAPQSAVAQPAASCSVRSGASAATVVELYTSEGCSSCPPADRWLSQIGSNPSLVPIAYHVNYWDRLGWRDRYATPQFTQRQAQQQAVNGARYNYTPQVVVQGNDRRDWPRLTLSAPLAQSAPVDIVLRGDGRNFVASVQALAGAPARLSAFWVVTESGHSNAVTAGENAGARLVHDHVALELLEVTSWEGALRELQFSPTSVALKSFPRSINLVVTDAASGRPIQAVKLGC
jgi:hypothetical protein